MTTLDTLHGMTDTLQAWDMGEFYTHGHVERYYFCILDLRDKSDTTVYGHEPHKVRRKAITRWFARQVHRYLNTA